MTMGADPSSVPSGLRAGAGGRPHARLSRFAAGAPGTGAGSSARTVTGRAVLCDPDHPAVTRHGSHPTEEECT
ncbi:protein of unknown function [Streptantibioticus cattleyicolor NRRL 8057 = DSM 46488]|nr:protein of unknown function [Streptantibioticus cattleyicolor NRRL 8057 = DSM 46488]